MKFGSVRWNDILAVKVEATEWITWKGIFYRNENHGYAML